MSSLYPKNFLQGLHDRGLPLVHRQSCEWHCVPHPSTQYSGDIFPELPFFLIQRDRNVRVKPKPLIFQKILIN